MYFEPNISELQKESKGWDGDLEKESEELK